MSFRFFALCLALWFTAITFVVAQPGGTTLNEYAAERYTAQTHIKSLKETALLVRLKTRDRSIEAYRKSGAELLAAKIEREQFEENKLLMDLFTEKFTFCPLYFFYTSDTKAVQNGELRGIFLNDKLQRDTTIVLPYANYYIAELDVLYETLPDLGYADDDEEMANSKGNSRHAETTLQRVIVIKDRNFTQLRRPFPFYIRASFDRFLPDKIEKLNNRLTNFYNDNTSGR